MTHQRITREPRPLRSPSAPISSFRHGAGVLAVGAYLMVNGCNPLMESGFGAGGGAGSTEEGEDTTYWGLTGTGGAPYGEAGGAGGVGGVLAGFGGSPGAPPVEHEEDDDDSDGEAAGCAGSEGTE